MTLLDSTNAFDRPPGMPLANLIEIVGSTLLRRLTPEPSSSSEPSLVSEVILHDPHDPLPDGRGAILLVPGVGLDAEAPALIGDCAGRGYAGIALKTRGLGTESVIAVAQETGIALIGVDDDAAWDHVASMLVSAVGARDRGTATGSSGEALFALANATALAARGAVAIEDLDRRVVAHSSIAGQQLDRLREEGILSRRVPEVESNLRRYRQLFASNSIERFDADGDERRRAALAIRAGTRPLGSVWLIEPDDGLDDEGERALTEAAGLAALHILRQQTSEEMRFQLREDLVLGALEARWPVRELGARLALATDSAIGLLAFAAPPDGTGWLTIMPYLSSAVSRFLVAFRPDAGIASTASAVYVLLPNGGVDGAMRLAHRAHGAMTQNFGDQLRIAVAASMSGPHELPDARREVDDILRATLANPALPRVASLDAVRSEVLLERVARELQSEPGLRHPAIAAILESDSTEGTDYRDTILAWFESMGDVAGAAERRDVHPNTLRYRLRRIQSRFGLDLDNPNERLAVWLQLRVGP